MDSEQQFDCQEAVYSEEYGDFIVDAYRDIENVRQLYDIRCLQVIEGNHYIGYGPNVNDIATNINKIGYRTIPKLYGLMDTTNIEESGIFRIRRLPYLDLLGQDVLVGIIDTGIDYQNPLFINADNTSRIRAIWDQTIPSDRHPKDIIYGTEYTKEDIDQALQSEDPISIVPSTDENGHGTFLAGIIAGNIDEENDFTGIAPQAEFVVVKLKPAKQYLREFFGIIKDAVAFQENDIIIALRYLIDKSIELQKSISICLGLGTNSGGHDGSSPLSSYMDFVANFNGVCVSTAAGNEGNADNHFEGLVPFSAFEDVEINIGPEDKNLMIELWAPYPSLFSVAIISPSGELAEKVPARTNLSVDISFVLEPTTVRVTYAIIDSATGNEMVALQFRNLVPGVWRIRVYNEYTVGNTFHIWMPITQFLSDETRFLIPNPYTTLVETGTTGRPISTTAYDHVNNRIYFNASRGYTFSGRIKPDLAAPGVNIYGPTGRNTYGVLSGSSVAAAHTAGIGAIFLQWGERLIQDILDVDYISNINTLNTSEIKAILIKGAIRRDRTYPNRDWGYGAINAFEAFESLRIKL